MPKLESIHLKYLYVAGWEAYQFINYNYSFDCVELTLYTQKETVERSTNHVLKYNI